jgi:signal peptidase I
MNTESSTVAPRGYETDAYRSLRLIRNTVESIGIAVVLAFVLRAFTIEAFVIPTGSMAPRLFGAHWHLQCTECGYEFDYGWVGPDAPRNATPSRPDNAVCPNCRAPYSGPARFVDGGDRVLVLKYLYNFRPPQPWDVVVFRNPQNNGENYIKRLIALPGETVQLVHGDVWVQSPAGSEWQIRRKPQHVQDVMWQLIHNNDYLPTERSEGCPFWAPQGSFNSPDQGRSFVFDGDSPGQLNFVCDTANYLPRYGYNNPNREPLANSAQFYQDVCTDVKVSCVFTPQTRESEINLFLDVMDQSFSARVQANGTIELRRRVNGVFETLQTTSLAPLAIGRGRQIALAHVDWQVKVLVDGEVLLATTDDADQYRPDYDTIRATMEMAYAHTSRSPVIDAPEISITTEGPCQVSHLAVHRDVYYTGCVLDIHAGRRRGQPLGPETDYAVELTLDHDMQIDGYPGWGVLGREPLTLQGDPDNPQPTDSFFVLGDNSPQSVDSRHWASAAPTLRLWDDEGQPIYQLGTVPRYQMIGKAVFVYWPGGFRLPLPGMSRLALIPNFGRMRPID